MEPTGASRRIETSVGPLALWAREGALVRVTWLEGAADEPGRPPPDPASQRVLAEALEQLEAYFAGARRRFELPLAPAGTPFEQRVWRELLRIPWGETRRYGDLARALGGVPRAVGRACGANPIPIIIPCHRVVAGGGGLGGYSGGAGVATKRLLLGHEGVLSGELFASQWSSNEPRDTVGAGPDRPAQPRIPSSQPTGSPHARDHH